MTKLIWLQSQKSANPNMSLEELLSFLNTLQLVDNPIPQGLVPVQLDINDVAGIVTPTERFAIAETRTYDKLLDAATQGNVTWILGNLQTLVAGNVLSENSFNLIIAELQKTQLDPNYQTQIWLTPAEQAGFDKVTATEIYSL